MRPIHGLVAALAASLALAAGCGGDGGGGGGPTAGAEIVPASAAIFVALNTDFEGEQWRTAEDLLDRFPAAQDALDAALSDLQEQEDIDFDEDVRPALGPEVDIVILDVTSDEPAVVVLTQPDDEAKFRELVEAGDDPGVVRQIDEWWLAARDEATLDAFEEARGDDSLADSDLFGETTGALPEDALATVYVNGAALTDALEASGQAEENQAALECSLGSGDVPSMAFSLGAEDDGARLSGAVRAENLAGGDEGGSELAGELEAGALVFVSFRGLDQQTRDALRCLRDTNEEFNEDLSQAEAFLDISVEEDILPLFQEETALVVYPPGDEGLAQDAPFEIPGVVLVTQVENEDDALRVADDLADKASAFSEDIEVEEVDVGGVPARQVTRAGEAVLFYAVFDGKLVVASTEDGITAAQGDDGRLADDEGYSGAREAAGAPDETTGYWYVDLEDGIDFFVDAYTATQGEEIPPEVEASLDALRAFVLWTGSEDDVYTFESFLQIE